MQRTIPPMELEMAIRDLMIISNPKLRALFILILACSLTGISTWYIGHSLSAPSRNSIIPPGGQTTPCTYDNFVDGSTFLGRDCHTGDIVYSDSNATNVLQAEINVIDALAGGIGGSIFLEAGIYPIGQLTILGNAVTVRGEGLQTRLDYAGTGACIQIGNDISSFFYDTIQDLRCNLTSGPSVGFLIMGNTYYGQLVRVRVTGSTTLSTGIEFKVITTFITGWTVINALMQTVKFGFKFDGSGPAGQGVTDTVILSGFVNGASQGVSGSTGIYVDRPDTLKIYGLSLNAFETMVNETSNANADEYHGLRLESCTTGFKLAGHDALIIGGTAPCTTVLVNTGARNRIEGLYGNFGRAFTTISYKSLVSSISTTSGSYVSTGFGVPFTPIFTGNSTINFVASIAFDNGCDIAIYRTTGSIPTLGSATTGTNIVAGRSQTSAVGYAQFPLQYLDTGLTLNTAYNYYAAYLSFGGATGCQIFGAAGASTTNILVEEITM